MMMVVTVMAEALHLHIMVRVAGARCQPSPCRGTSASGRSGWSVRMLQQFDNALV